MQLLQFLEMSHKIYKFICSGFVIGYIPLFPGNNRIIYHSVSHLFFKENFETNYFLLLILIIFFISLILISKNY